MFWRGRGTYRPTNSGPAAGARAAVTPSLPRALSPASFPFDHSTQGLAAGRAAKLLAGAVSGANEPLLAPGTLAAKKIEFTRWMLTLAGVYRRRAMRLRGGGNRRLGFGGLGFDDMDFGGLGFDDLGFCRQGFRLQSLGATASIALALSPPLLASLGVLAIFPAVASFPPSASSLAALRTAISSLRMSGAEGFLASLEQTRSPPRPTSPLTSLRFTASW